VLTHLAILNPVIDSKLNEQNGRESNGRISTESALLCLVIPTNEELMIARETDALTT
jgi:acetate kinase